MVLRSTRGRRIAYQAAAIGAAVLVAWFLISNTLANLEARKIASGFGFLGRESGFEIGETVFMRYSASDTYLRALVVGLTNTLAVALVGVVLATGRRRLGVLLLGACSMGWLGDEPEAPPLPGERVSILELQKQLEPDDEAVKAQGFVAPSSWANEYWPQAGGYPNHSMQHMQFTDGQPQKNLERGYR